VHEARAERLRQITIAGDTYLRPSSEMRVDVKRVRARRLNRGPADALTVEACEMPRAIHHRLRSALATGHARHERGLGIQPGASRQPTLIPARVENMPSHLKGWRAKLDLHVGITGRC